MEKDDVMTMTERSKEMRLEKLVGSTEIRKLYSNESRP